MRYMYRGAYPGVGACPGHYSTLFKRHGDSPSLAISILVTKLTTTLPSPPALLVSMATPSGPEEGVTDGGTCAELRTPSMETVSVLMVCNNRVLAHKLINRKEYTCTCTYTCMYMYKQHVHVHGAFYATQVSAPFKESV